MRDDRGGQRNQRGKSAVLAVVAVVAVIAAVVLGIANVTRLVPYAAVWGPIGTWVQAVLSVGGLIFAALSVRTAAQAIDRSRQSDVDRELLHHDQARRSILLRCRWKVDYSRAAPRHADRACLLDYEVINASTYPISNCKLMIHQFDDDNERLYANMLAKTSPSIDDFFQAVVIGSLGPGERASGSIPVTNQDAAHSWWGADPVATPDMTFTDAWGAHWLRPGTTSVRQPANDQAEEHPQCMCCGTPADVFTAR